MIPIILALCLLSSAPPEAAAQEVSTPEDNENVDQGFRVEIRNVSPAEMKKILDSLPPPQETKFSEMIKLCKNLDSENRIREPDESKKECRQRYRELRREYRRETRKICKRADTFEDPEVRALARETCDKFGPRV